MTFYEVGFRVQHECPFTDLSKRYPGAAMVVWFHYGKSIIDVSCKDLATAQNIKDYLSNMTITLGMRLVHTAYSGTHMQVVLPSSFYPSLYRAGQRVRGVVATIEAHDCFAIPPYLFTGGWENYRVVAFTRRDIARMLKALSEFCTIEIKSRRTIPTESVRDLFAISLNTLFAGLTARQAEALLAAFERGYYRIPKKITTEEIAGHLGMPRSTYEEHLRKAESKVVHALAAYLQMYTGPARQSSPTHRS